MDAQFQIATRGVTHAQKQGLVGREYQKATRRYRARIAGGWDSKKAGAALKRELDAGCYVNPRRSP